MPLSPKQEQEQVPDYRTDTSAGPWPGSRPWSTPTSPCWPWPPPRTRLLPRVGIVDTNTPNYNHNPDPNPNSNPNPNPKHNANPNPNPNPDPNPNPNPNPIPTPTPTPTSALVRALQTVAESDTASEEMEGLLGLWMHLDRAVRRGWYKQYIYI